MLSATQPDARFALEEKRALAQLVITDIGRVIETTAPTAAVVLYPLLAALAAELDHLDDGEVGQAVGPELYRWLALAGHAASRGDEVSIATAIETLPHLLLTRLSISEAEGVHWIPRQAGLCPLPQAGLAVTLAPGPTLVEARLSGKMLSLDGVDVDRSWLRTHVDGAAPGPRLGSSRVFFHQRGTPVADMVDDLRRTASIPVGRDEHISLIPPRQFEEPHVAPIIANMAEGLALLRRYCPGHADEVESVLDAVTLVSGRRFVGGSDIWYQGVAVLNPDLDWSSTTYADHLVHEGAHLALHACNELTPVLRNGGAMGAKSPIRQDPRPLYGILHSTFVFMRLVQFFRVVAPAIESDEAQFRLHRHLLGFYDGMAELERHADFTLAGGRMFSAMREVRSRFRSELPDPDPRFYKRVGKDYVV